MRLDDKYTEQARKAVEQVDYLLYEEMSLPVLVEISDKLSEILKFLAVEQTSKAS